MRSTVVLNLFLMAAWVARADVLWCQETGTTTFIQDSPAIYDVTLTWVVGDGWANWEMSDNSSPCLYSSDGCHLGSFTFTPPAVNLPPGARILDEGRPGWEFMSAFDISDTSFFTFRVVRVVSHYPWGDVEGGWSFDIPGWVGNIILVSDATKDSLRPVTADVYYQGTPKLPQIIDPGQNPGDTINFHNTFALTDIADVNRLGITYEFPQSVPEPATTWLVAIAVVGIGVGARKRNA